MRVVLLSCTKDPLQVVGAAARTCYSAKDPESIFSDLFFESEERKAADLLDRIHGSVFEHAVFTFAVEGISRDCTHQLVRHRLASFSQQSQRYVDMSKADTYTPQTIIDADSMDYANNTEYIYQKAVDAAFVAYDELVKAGVPKEDARYILPGATLSNIVVTMNARELMHFFDLRLCTRAQDEIRELASKMLVQVQQEAPDLFRHAGPQCKRLGYCPEHRSCGRMPTMADLHQCYEKCNPREAEQ